MQPRSVCGAFSHPVAVELSAILERGNSKQPLLGKVPICSIKQKDWTIEHLSKHPYNVIIVYIFILYSLSVIFVNKKFFIFNHSIRLSIFLKMVNNICLEETVYFLLIHANILCSEISFLMIPRWFLAWRFFRTVYFTRRKNGSSVRNV